MKRKTIAKTIMAKMEDFLTSIPDEKLKKELREGIIVTGGCITSMFLQEPVNDYDVYFATPELAFKVAQHYALTAKSNACVEVLLHLKEDWDCSNHFAFVTNPDYIKIMYNDKVLVPNECLKNGLSDEEFTYLKRVEMFVHSVGLAVGQEVSLADQNAEDFISANSPKPKYVPEFISSNAITLTDKVQLVLRFTGDAAEIHTNYDFIHTTNYWTYGEGLVTNIEALEATLAKELIYSGSMYPLASILRTRKFIKREWSCHVGNYIKMALQLNELNLFDPDVLRDQLTGVDMAYMQAVITAVEEKKKNSPTFEFNAEWLCQVVDRLMGEQSDRTD